MYNHIILNMYCNKYIGYRDPPRANDLPRVCNEDDEAAIIPVNEHGPQQEIGASLDDRTPCN